MGIRTCRHSFFLRIPLARSLACVLLLGQAFRVEAAPADPAEEKPSRHELRVGPTVVVVPSGWRPFSAAHRVFELDGWKLIVYSRSFSRGELCYAELLPPAPVSPGGQGPVPGTQIASGDNSAAAPDHFLYYKGSVQRQVQLHRFQAGLQGMFLIPPDQNGDAYLTWVMKRGNETKKDTFQLVVHLIAFPESRSVLPFDSKYADPSKANEAELAKRLEEERALKNRAFASASDWSFDARLSHPRDFHRITSPFYISRLNERYIEKDGKRVFLEPQHSIHRGTDFRGLPGTPVFALASGIVVLAHEMYYEGNFTIIDHGFGILTGYMHQKKLLVKTGDRVKAGQQIGEVGATGMVTGAHLHLSVWVWGLPGDPLSLLSLPLR